MSSADISSFNTGELIGQYGALLYGRTVFADAPLNVLDAELGRARRAMMEKVMDISEVGI